MKNNLFLLSTLIAVLFVGVSRGTKNNYIINFVSEETASAATGLLNQIIPWAADSLGNTYMSSSVSGTAYSFIVDEQSLSTGSMICYQMESQLQSIACNIVNVTKGATPLCTPSKSESCNLKIETEYEIKTSVESSLDKNVIDSILKSMCAQSMDFINSTFDSGSGIYKVWVNESSQGLFGTVFNKSIETSEYKCMIEYFKSDDTIYYERPEDCPSGVETEYEIKVISGSSLDKSTLDSTFKSMCANIQTTGTMVKFINSTFDSDNGIYKFWINEPLPDAFGGTFNKFIETSEYKCMIEYMKSGDITYYKRSEDCPSGIETEYEVKIIFGASLDKSTLDSTFKSMCTNTQLMNFINSTFDSDSGIYKVWVNESSQGFFGTAFNKSIETSEYKCMIEYLKSDDTFYYNRTEGCDSETEYIIKFSIATEDGIDKSTFDSYVGEMCTQLRAAAGVNITLINSTIDASSGTYKVFMGEPAAGVFGSAFNKSIGGTGYECVIEYVKSGDKLYYNRTEECESGVDVLYEIKLLFTSEDLMNKTVLDSTINKTCSSISGIGISFLNSTFDSKNSAYMFWMNEPARGLFGRMFGQTIKAMGYECVIVYMKSGETTYYTAPDSCAEPTEYEFTLSTGIPDNMDKESIDELITNLIKNSGFEGVVSFNSSKLDPSAYRAYIHEPITGVFGDAICRSINSSADGGISAYPELCYITAIKCDGETKCVPSASAECESTSLGHNTVYSIKVMEDAPADISSKEGMDAIFKTSADFIRNFTANKMVMVNSTYSKRVYEVVITEPAAGVFGSMFCQHIESIGYKCYIEWVRDNETEYCVRNSSSCPPIKYYTLTFVSDGDVVKTETLRYKDDIVFPVVRKNGYVLDGWDPDTTTMPAQDLTVTAVWAKVTGYVEIVFTTTDLNKEEAAKIIKAYTNSSFVIERVEATGENGESKVIIKFTDTESAMSFVETINASENTNIESVNLITERILSFSHLFNPLLFVMSLLF